MYNGKFIYHLLSSLLKTLSIYGCFLISFSLIIDTTFAYRKWRNFGVSIVVFICNVGNNFHVFNYSPFCWG